MIILLHLQNINYQFSACNQALDAGTISIGENDEFIYHIPSGCPDIPEIQNYLSVSVDDDCAQPVEHMWLVSTVERSNGVPFFPNSFNTGPAELGFIWSVVPNATDAVYTPNEITQNTYYVRCSRTISCCDYLESNIVSFIIDTEPDATCPIVESPDIADDCELDILLSNPTDNLFNIQILELSTNRIIRAENTVGTGAFLRLNAKRGTALEPGFEVEPNAQLQIDTDGCNNEE